MPYFICYCKYLGYSFFDSLTRDPPKKSTWESPWESPWESYVTYVTYVTVVTLDGNDGNKTFYETINF